MTSGHKHPLSLLAVQGHNRQKVLCRDDHAESQVAPPTKQQQWAVAPQCVPGEGDSPMFTFGSARGTMIFLFVGNS